MARTDEDVVTLNCEDCGEVVWEGSNQDSDAAAEEHEDKDGDGKILCDGCAEHGDNETPQTEADLEDALVYFFDELKHIAKAEECCDACTNVPAPTRAKSFSDVGMLTRNNGIVLEYGDVEFQITIVRSK